MVLKDLRKIGEFGLYCNFLDSETQSLWFDKKMFSEILTQDVPGFYSQKYFKLNSV